MPAEERQARGAGEDPAELDIKAGARTQKAPDITDEKVGGRIRKRRNEKTSETKVRLSPPLNSKEMPSPISISIKNIDATHDACQMAPAIDEVPYDGKPTQRHCPLRDTPHMRVEGRHPRHPLLVRASQRRLVAGADARRAGEPAGLRDAAVAIEREAVLA